MIRNKKAYLVLLSCNVSKSDENKKISKKNIIMEKMRLET